MLLLYFNLLHMCEPRKVKFFSREATKTFCALFRIIAATFLRAWTIFYLQFLNEAKSTVQRNYTSRQLVIV